MKHFVERFGPWALVTGASSGIGEAFARRLAEMDMNLVLVARREERLRTLADDLKSQHSISARVVPVDLSQGDFLPIIEQATVDLQIGLLVNNAGIATTGMFLDNELGSELALLSVNTQAPLILAHHFGKSMQKQGRGGMIFVSSTVAFAGVPSWSAYAASKAHALVFAEGLAQELRPDGISVLAVCPGPTRTDLWPAGAQPLFPMRPEAVVNLALRKLEKDHRRCRQDQFHHCLLNAPAAEIVEHQNIWMGGRRDAQGSQSALWGWAEDAHPALSDPRRARLTWRKGHEPQKKSQSNGRCSPLVESSRPMGTGCAMHQHRLARQRVRPVEQEPVARRRSFPLQHGPRWLALVAGLHRESSCIRDPY